MSGRGGARARGREDPRPGPPHPGRARGESSGRLPADPAAARPEPRAGTIRPSRLLALTHSRERLGPRANQSKEAAATSKTGRDCSAPSSPATSLRPKTALGRSCYDPPQLVAQLPVAKCPSCSLESPRAPTRPGEEEPVTSRAGASPRATPARGRCSPPFSGKRSRRLEPRPPRPQPLRRSCLQLRVPEFYLAYSSVLPDSSPLKMTLRNKPGLI